MLSRLCPRETALSVSQVGNGAVAFGVLEGAVQRRQRATGQGQCLAHEKSSFAVIGAMARLVRSGVIQRNGVAMSLWNVPPQSRQENIVWTTVYVKALKDIEPEAAEFLAMDALNRFRASGHPLVDECELPRGVIAAVRDGRFKFANTFS